MNIIKILIMMMLLSSIGTASATSYNPADIASKEFVTGQYGEIGCFLGLGDCVYKITNNDGSQYYKLDRSKLSLASIVDSKSQISTTINQGQTASISYTVKGSGADGFNAHNQKYEWYDYNSNSINNFLINLPFDKEYVVIQKLVSPPSSGTYEYTVIEWIEINLINDCYYLHTNPCTGDDVYRQVWAMADEYYPKVIVAGGAVTPTPTPGQTSTPGPTATPPGSSIVKLNTIPSGAQIFVSNVYLGLSPINIEFSSSGTKVVVIVKADYTTKTITVSSNDGSRTETLAYIGGTPTGTPTPTQTVSPTGTPTVTITALPCPDGLIWDGSKCIIPPTKTDDSTVYYAIAGIILLAGLIYIQLTKPEKSRKKK